MNYKNCTTACLGCDRHSLEGCSTFYLSKVKDNQQFNLLCLAPALLSFIQSSLRELYLQHYRGDEQVQLENHRSSVGASFAKSYESLFRRARA